jgi:hypothetical protein
MFTYLKMIFNDQPAMNFVFKDQFSTLCRGICIIVLSFCPLSAVGNCTRRIIVVMFPLYFCSLGKGGGGKKHKGAKKKGKKHKDLTADRTVDELFEELCRNNVIHPYPEVKLSWFIGQHHYAAFEMRQSGLRPLQALGDIRNLISQYCILPFGSPDVHQLAPLVKSVCIIGPRGESNVALLAMLMHG